jgi:outer membrane protein assembly factor BamE (lipoprotein component of BamABCDE complex)|tara:strand:- start:345 stop:764 length:420 start_codon:yes stop_codon:yes gene_type:complete
MLSLLLIGACSPTFKNHGYVPSRAELNQLKVGKSSKENVKNLFGSPSSIGLVQDDRWFYLYTRIKNFMYRSPEIVERQLVVVTFTSNGLLENIERFELQDQEVVVLSRRITESGIKGMSLIQQLLNSAGNYDPAQAFEQ